MVCSASETAVAVPACCFCTALQYDATPHQEMSRVELNLAAAASPSHKLGLIHQRTGRTERHTFEFCR